METVTAMCIKADQVFITNCNGALGSFFQSYYQYLSSANTLTKNVVKRGINVTSHKQQILKSVWRNKLKVRTTHTTFSNHVQTLTGAVTGCGLKPQWQRGGAKVEAVRTGLVFQ